MQVNLNLLSAASATGASFSLSVSGRYCFSAAGTFDGGTVSLQMLGPDGSTWFDVGDEATMTSVGAGIAELPSGDYRAGITGGSGSVSVYATLKSVAETV